jgi:hypothetical protein
LVVTGGYNIGEEDDRRDGASFEPLSGTWSAIAARPAPGSCGGAVPCAGFWTGSVALFPGTGLAYDPAGDRWSPMAALPAGDGLVTEETVVWTGRRLLVWGHTPPASGGDGGDEVQSVEGGDETDDSAEVIDDGMTDGGSDDAAAGFGYDPAGNSWQPFPVWGGNAGETGLADGAAYRPAG